VKRVLHLVLLLGALVGLLGLQTAYAAVPPVQAQPAAMAGMDPDCIKMMQKQQPQPENGPCKGMTLECIAAMGCIPQPMPMAAVIAYETAPIVFEQAFWPAASVLDGRERPPEQHPPTILG